MVRIDPPTKDEIRSFAIARGADLVGFVSTARLDEVIPTKYKPSRLWPAAKTAISVGKRFLAGAARVGVTEAVENARWVAWHTCDALNTLALEIGDFLERRGAMALPLSAGNMADPGVDNKGLFAEISHRHVAVQAGLGVIGVPTFCVTPQLGPRVYFNTVLTVLRLESDPLLDFDPCGTGCDACIRACPGGAIQRGRAIRKLRCIPYAMPHGARPMQDFIVSLLNTTDRNEQVEMLRDSQFLRLYRATVQGVGTIAGCFHCLNACPVGKGSARRTAMPDVTREDEP